MFGEDSISTQAQLMQPAPARQAAVPHFAEQFRELLRHGAAKLFCVEIVTARR